MTVKAAKLFAEHLHVREEYLLDEDDKKTVTEMFKKRKNLFDQLNEITTALLNLAGFKPICNFIENWKELGLDRTIYGPFTEGDTPGMHTDPDLDGKIKFSTEIQTPNGKKFYCDTEDFELLEYEILEYIKFRMTQLESKYAWKYDDGAIFPKCKGSEVYIYPEPGKNISENPDYLENSIWVNHDDDFFPRHQCLGKETKDEHFKRMRCFRFPIWYFFGTFLDFLLPSCYTTSRCKALKNQGLSGLPPIPGVK